MPDGSTVRLRDVARIEIGGLSYQFNTRLNGKPTAGLSVLLSPTGNALATASAVEAKMKELSQLLPGQYRLRNSLQHHARGRRPRSRRC